MFTFEGLYPGQFVITDCSLALLRQSRGALIQVVDVADFLIGPLIGPRR
jgi:hypothetical protein